MKKTVLYLRDTRRTPKLANAGFAAQEKALREFCDKHEIEVVKVYKETYETIANDEEALRQISDDIKSKVTEANIFFWQSSRIFWRSKYGSFRFQCDLGAHGLRPASLDQIPYTLKLIDGLIPNHKYEK